MQQIDIWTLHIVTDIALFSGHSPLEKSYSFPYIRPEMVRDIPALFDAETSFLPQHA